MLIKASLGLLYTNSLVAIPIQVLINQHLFLVFILLPDLDYILSNHSPMIRDLYLIYRRVVKARNMSLLFTIIQNAITPSRFSLLVMLSTILFISVCWKEAYCSLLQPGQLFMVILENLHQLVKLKKLLKNYVVFLFLNYIHICAVILF